VQTSKIRLTKELEYLDMEPRPKQITSLQHPLIKKLVSLREKKEVREEEGLVVVSGSKLIQELALEIPIEILVLPQNSLPPKGWKVKALYWVTAPIFKKITGLVESDPIAAVFPLPRQKPLTNKSWILALDGVSDPGNVGTLLRTAAGLGWEGVFFLPGCADPMNDKALRGAKGATFWIDFCFGSTEDLVLLAKTNALPLWGADLAGKPLAKTLSPPSGGILVLGNEARGITENLRRKCQMLLIPLSDKIESLNVASAGAILLYNLKNER
jgi:TrmH family RNA methyltransferase